MKRVLGTCFLGAVAFAATARAGFDHGPWVQSTTATGAEILIEGDAGDTPGLVEYGTTLAYGASAPLAVYNGPAAGGEIYRAALTGLAPDARYFYRVTHEGASRDGTFFTAAPPGQTFTFVVVGDTRSNANQHTNVVQAVVDQLGGAFPDLYFNTGDLVESGELEDDWDTFFAIETGTTLLPNTVFHAIFGNHDDGEFLAPTLFYRYFSAHASKLNVGYYAFDYGSAHFNVVSTETLCAAGSPQGQWLASDLAQANANPATPFKFNFFHQVGVTTGSGHAPKDCITGTGGLIDVFETHNTDISFAGHNHQYEHTLLNGVHHVTQGGGGVGTSGFDRTSSYTVYKEGMFGFTVVTVSATSWAAETYKVDAIGGGIVGLVDSWSGSIAGGGVPGPTPPEFSPTVGGCSTTPGSTSAALATAAWIPVTLGMLLAVTCRRRWLSRSV